MYFFVVYSGSVFAHWVERILKRHAQNDGSTLSFVSSIKANHFPFNGALKKYFFM